MASSGVVDALPYIDQEYDIPVLKETVSKLNVHLCIYLCCLFSTKGAEVNRG